MTNPMFTIVIPTFNREDFIGKTIESVLSQTYPNYEVIVVDDGSTDNTEAVVKPYISKNVHYHRKENAERGAARNYGTSLSQGDYINWFDSDDLMLPNHLEEANNFVMQNNSPVVFAFSHQVSNMLDNAAKRVILPHDINKTLFKGNFISCNAVFVRRDVALKYKFNESRRLSGSEDYDLWMRLAARFPFFSSASITSTLQQHDGRSMSNLDIEKIESRIEYAWNCLWADDQIVEKYSDHKSYMEGFKEAFLAVHFAEAKNYKRARRKLRSAFKAYPSIVVNRTFLATVKKLIIN